MKQKKNYKNFAREIPVNNNYLNENLIGKATETLVDW
jgi:hypothetical protein